MRSVPTVDQFLREDRGNICVSACTWRTTVTYIRIVILEVVRTRVFTGPFSQLALSQLTFSEITAKFSQKRMKM